MEPGPPPRCRRSAALDRPAGRARRNAAAPAPRRTPAGPRSCSWGHRLLGAWRSAHVVGEEGHRLALPRAGRLVHDYLEPREVGANLLGRQEMGASREDGRLEHRMAGAAEPHEIATHTAVHHSPHNPRAGRGPTPRPPPPPPPGASRFEPPRA